jgi:hypothetical protein
MLPHEHAGKRVIRLGRLHASEVAAVALAAADAGGAAQGRSRRRRRLVAVGPQLDFAIVVDEGDVGDRTAGCVRAGLAVRAVQDAPDAERARAGCREEASVGRGAGLGIGD